MLLLVFYSVHRRDISPVPLLAFPVYDAATAGYLGWAIAIPAGYMAIGLMLAVFTTKERIAGIATDFLPSIALAIAGLDRLETLVDAVRAAGAPVTVTVDGTKMPVPQSVDHTAYRILQESLTNVLRHAGQNARATVALLYATDALTITVA